MSDVFIKIISGTGVPIVGNDIDTDRIIPARYLKEITFEKMGNYLFHDVRFDTAGNETAHPLNDKKFKGASIAFVNKNFGCGSSREHAPQAIMRYGIKAIVGESFAEIFAGNCQRIGVPVVTVSAESIVALQEELEKNPSLKLELNLEKKALTIGDKAVPVDLPDSRQKSFLNGSWNVLNLLKLNADKIAEKDRDLSY